MQLRFRTGLTGEQYVTTQGWRDATLVRCPNHPGGGCSLARHGTYARKTPAGTCIARWYCPESHTTFSLLPDCLAARLPGTLAELEDAVVAAERFPSVACGSQDNSVHFWRRSTERDAMMSGYPGKPSALAFDKTGALLATGGGVAVTVWNFQGSGPEGTQPGVLEQHAQTVTTLAFARRGLRLASGGRDGGVVVWSLGRDGQGDAIGTAAVADVVGALYWRPDGRALAALDAQGGVTVWRVGN